MDEEEIIVCECWGEGCEKEEWIQKATTCEKRIDLRGEKEKR